MSLTLIHAAARTSPAALARRAGRHPIARGARDLGAALLRAADRLCRDYAARRLLREMRDWPDDRLEDLGLTRGELANAILGIKRPFRRIPETDPDAPPVSRARG